VIFEILEKLYPHLGVIFFVSNSSARFARSFYERP
jgi:hypothetical protein